jgi:heavy metal sensor kinase
MKRYPEIYPFFFQILDDQGKLIYRSRGFDGIQYPPFEKVVSNARIGKRTREDISFSSQKKLLRVVSTPLIEEGRLLYIIQFGTHLYFVKKSLSNFKINLMAALPIVLILGALGGWVLARRSLLPSAILLQTQSITSENLSERLYPRGTDDEMDDLIRTINEMILRLETSFKRLAEFTADTSHELRTPLCAMRGEAEVLLSKPRSPEEYQEALVHFIEGFDRLNQMINDLILLSKFDAAQIELKKTPLRLDLLVKDLGNLFQVLAEQKGIFEVNAPEETTIVGDKIRLQQLFTNLIDNAIKYTSKGLIRITLEKHGETIRVQVKDTGVGISKEEQGKIFKRFYRVDKSRSRETGGVGLGLSIAEWIVQAHDGRIEVQSELNQGSTFKVYLPLFKDHTAKGKCGFVEYKCSK